MKSTLKMEAMDTTASSHPRRMQRRSGSTSRGSSPHSDITSEYSAASPASTPTPSYLSRSYSSILTCNKYDSKKDRHG